MELLIATNNQHKVEEFKRIFKGYSVISPSDINLDFFFDETAETFMENSFGKAMALHKMTGKRVIADDSGLCVTALDNAPGVYSARYGMGPSGQELASEERNAFLLKNMQGVEDRRAFFVCSMVLILSEHRFFAAQETVEGQITTAPAGCGGFGYDPVFYVPRFGKTIAELDSSEKDCISHRGKASRIIQHHLELIDSAEE